MRTVRFELLRPGEIIEEKKRCPVVYAPVGPLEWHGPHLPLGTDPLKAEAVAQRLAENIGGVVLPTLFWGTDRLRPEAALKNLGFSRDERIMGMDFPANTMPSMYSSDEMFALVVREYLHMLVKQGYKLIVLVNGHGGVNHIATLRRLAEEFTHDTNCKVIYTMALIDENGLSIGFGHATRTETSILSYLHADSVDLTILPAKDQKLYNTQWAIVDSDTFCGKPNEDFSVREDPRDANAEEGKFCVENAVKVLTEVVREAMKEI